MIEAPGQWACFRPGPQGGPHLLSGLPLLSGSPLSRAQHSAWPLRGLRVCLAMSIRVLCTLLIPDSPNGLLRPREPTAALEHCQLGNLYDRGLGTQEGTVPWPEEGREMPSQGSEGFSALSLNQLPGEPRVCAGRNWELREVRPLPHNHTDAWPHGVRWGSGRRATGYFVCLYPQGDGVASGGGGLVTQTPDNQKPLYNGNKHQVPRIGPRTVVLLHPAPGPSAPHPQEPSQHRGRTAPPLGKRSALVPFLGR